MINNKGGLRLLMQALFRGLQEIIPIELLYRVWKNSEGQVRLGLCRGTSRIRQQAVTLMCSYP